MSAKKIIGFFIATGTLLAVSLVLTFTLILPNHFNTKYDNEVICYAFNVGGDNDSKIAEVTETTLTLAKSVKFAPNKSVEWSDGFLCFGNTINDKIEYSNTQTSNYICAIPFSVSNSTSDEIKFRVDVMVTGELEGEVSYKIYDYSDKKYRTQVEINTGFHDFDSKEISRLETNSSISFCLVCYVDGSGETIEDSANVNVQIVMI